MYVTNLSAETNVIAISTFKGFINRFGKTKRSTYETVQFKPMSKQVLWAIDRTKVLDMP